MKNKFLLFSYHLLFLLTACLATTLQAAEVTLNFRHLTASEGLPSNWVGALLQDQQGMIWIGTDRGLCRYDGFEFTRPAGSVPTSSVHALYEVEGTIWVGMDNGLYCYDSRTDSLMPAPLKLADGRRITSLVVSMASDKHAGLWISTMGQGIFRYNRDKGQLTQFSLPDGGQMAGDLIVDADGSIWAISKYLKEGGLVRYNQNTGSFEYIHLQADPPVDTRGLSMMQDSDGLIWIGTWDNGLIAFDPHTYRVVYDSNKQVLPPSKGNEGVSLSHIHSLMEYAPGILYIGSDDGMTRYETATGRMQHFLPVELDDRSINNQFVYPILRDNEGGLWVGTYYGGINYASPRSGVFASYLPSAYRNSLRGQVISRFCEDREGRIWIGSDDGGLSCFDPRRDQSFTHFEKEGTSPRNIHALCTLGDELWIGTYTQGIDVMNLRTGAIRHYRELLDIYDNSLGTSSYLLFVDRQGTLWAGTFTGLCRYNPKTDRFVSVKDFGSTPIGICQDLDGNLWICTEGNGIWRMKAGNDNEWKQYRDTTGYNVKDVAHSICIDNEGNLWAGSLNGLLAFDRKREVFEQVKLPEGFEDIQSIVADGPTLWIASSGGLSLYQPGQDGRIQTFSRGDGLSTTSYLPDAILRASDGRIYLGTTQGMQAFYPSQVKHNSIAPKVIFTGLDLGPQTKVAVGSKLLPQNLNTIPQLDLSYRNNIIGISFAALSYAMPEKNQFAIWLEGFDRKEQWANLGNQHRVTYTNLPAGKYTLHVKASNNDNVWSTDEARLAFVVHPPFYWNHWSRTLYLLLFFALIGLGVWFTLRRNNWQHLQEIQKLRHQNAQKINEARIQFFTTIAHEIRTPVSLIIAPLEKIRKQSAALPSNLRSDLSVIDRNSKRLLELVNQLLDFRKMESRTTNYTMQPCRVAPLLQTIVERFRTSMEERGIHLEAQLPDNDFAPCLNSEAITKLVSNLLSNALKYTKDDVRLICSVQPNDATWTIAVSDNGPGISEEDQKKIFRPFYQANENKPGTGIGLTIVKRVVEAHQGRVEVQSKVGEGTTFLVTLPSDLPASETTTSPLSPPIDPVPSVALPSQSPLNPHITSQPLSMLLVDDNEEMLNFLSESLKSQYKLLTATDGKQALKILEHNPVSLIVSDWMMPVMDGEQLCRSVRANQLTSHIPFIMLTAKTDDASKVKGMNCGADAYIEKPFSLDYLQACIDNLLSLRSMLIQKFSQQPLTPITEIASTPLDSDFLSRLEKLIEDNFSNSELNVDFLAQQLGISRSGFFAKIKTLANASPNEMIQMIRLKHAARLLKQGQYRVSEVCYMVGFNSPSYFSKCFQKQFGIKPTDFAAEQNP